MLRTAQVVVATCIGSGSDVLGKKGAGFALVIVDEASQGCARVLRWLGIRAHFGPLTRSGLYRDLVHGWNDIWQK
jgi:hypothetical protein